LDDLAKSVRDQYTAELDLMTRFGPKQIEPEINFKESLNKLEEQTTKMLTPRLISLLDGYIRNEFGPSASYLLALVSEYKKRRELS
jgi:hypothetical protein